MNKLDFEYQALLSDVLISGVRKETRNGSVLSVFGRNINFKFNGNVFPVLTTKKMHFKTIVTELLWFLRGDTNIKYLLDNNCHIWDGDAWANYQRKVLDKFMDDTTIANYGITNKEDFINRIKTDDEFAKKWGELGPIYGKQWRSWNTLVWEKTDIPDPIIKDDFILKWKIEGIDQIKKLIDELKNNPDSRRLLVSAWNVSELEEQVLPPCHFSFQMYTRELSLVERLKIYGKSDDVDMSYLDEYNIPKRAVSLIFNMRSSDVPLGLPFNISSYGLLLVIISKIVNMVPDRLIANLGDTHIYSNQVDAVKTQLERIPYDLPSLRISDSVDFSSIDKFLETVKPDDFELIGYESHPHIKIPLSN